MTKPARLTTVYGGPLSRELGLTRARALERLRGIVLKKVREKLFASALSERAKRSFAKAFSVRVTGSSLHVVSSHPAFPLLLKGQPKGTMAWLRGGRAPIPLEGEDGRVVFRYASAKSFANGGWRHPGRPKLTFVEKAKREAKAEIKRQVALELRRTILAARGAR